jgi:hypothetical protein
MDRENEYENPGGNYPDEGGSSTAAPPAPSNDDPAAGFAKTSPESAEETSSEPAAAGTSSEPAAARTPSGAAGEEPASPPAPEPSHEAVGIGVRTDAGSPADTAAGSPADTPAGSAADDRAQSGGGSSTDAESAASTDHHGQDGSRDTMSVSEAQRTPGALGTEQEQRLPAMSQNNASDVDKIAGIVAQTRSDLATEPVEEVERVLAQRFEQSGVDLPREEVAELARQITTGDAARPE